MKDSTKQNLLTVLAFLRGHREYRRDKTEDWRNKFDCTFPELSFAGDSPQTANESGWYKTLDITFSGSELPFPFVPSPHGKRASEYWCDEMVRVENNAAVITARKETAHACAVCGVKQGDFTSGIETRCMENGKSVPTFEQAFGFFEACVELPKSGGMWSAFWLQCNSVEQIGAAGEDGTEIDVYESSFYNTDRHKIGHALHFDGYSPLYHQCMDAIRPVEQDLYDGYHTFAVKWTPVEYVFYIDGKVSWASDFGGVCKVPAFLRLTNEIRPGKTGPYRQSLGEFSGGELRVRSVRVWQNVRYVPFTRKPSDFQNEKAK